MDYGWSCRHAVQRLVRRHFSRVAFFTFDTVGRFEINEYQTFLTSANKALPVL